jgi:Tol biopolymer transport system component
MRGEREPRISPDGHWLVYTAIKAGSKQIWLRRRRGGSAILLTGGNCNNDSPAWELDSQALIFASDCDRGIGLPALFRMPLNHVVGR